MELKKYYTNEQTGISYTLHGDYYLPDIILPPTEAKVRLGKWGMMHKDYLLKHKPTVVAAMTSEGKFWQYLAEIDKKSTEMFEMLVEQIKEKEDVNEQLKAENQMEWVQRMSNIQNRAREIVCQELIYV